MYRRLIQLGIQSPLSFGKVLAVTSVSYVNSANLNVCKAVPQSVALRRNNVQSFPPVTGPCRSSSDWRTRAVATSSWCGRLRVLTPSWPATNTAPTSRPAPVATWRSRSVSELTLRNLNSQLRLSWLPLFVIVKASLSCDVYCRNGIYSLLLWNCVVISGLWNLFLSVLFLHHVYTSSLFCFCCCIFALHIYYMYQPKLQIHHSFQYFIIRTSVIIMVTCYAYTHTVYPLYTGKTFQNSVVKGAEITDTVKLVTWSYFVLSRILS